MKTATLLLACPVLAACGSGSAEAPTAVRDSAGVRIVESRAPAWAEAEGWRVPPGPILDLSADFHGVTAALLLPDGAVLVGEESGVVRTFDASGALRWSAGGQGEGPGELRLLAGAGASGDSIWLYDYSLRRLTWLDPAGRLLGVAALETERPNLLPVGRLEDGSLVLGESWGAGRAGPETPLGLRRDTVDYLRFAPDGTLLGRMARLAGREYVLGAEEGRLTMATPPFARAASHAVARDALAHGDQERWEVRIVGAEPRILRLSEPPPPLDPERVAREIERRVERHSAAEAPARRRFLSGLPLPPHAPAYGALLADPDGNLWVGPAEPDGEWKVFDAGGTWLGDVVLPERFEPTQVFRDRVVGVWRDAMDIERVRVYGILK